MFKSYELATAIWNHIFIIWTHISYISPYSVALQKHTALLHAISMDLLLHCFKKWLQIKKLKLILAEICSLKRGIEYLYYRDKYPSLDALGSVSLRSVKLYSQNNMETSITEQTVKQYGLGCFSVVISLFQDKRTLRTTTSSIEMSVSGGYYFDRNELFVLQLLWKTFSSTSKPPFVQIISVRTDFIQGNDAKSDESLKRHCHSTCRLISDVLRKIWLTLE